MKKTVYSLLIFIFMFFINQFAPVIVKAENFFSGPCSGAEAQQSSFCKNVDAEGQKPLGTGKNSIIMLVAKTVIYLTAIISVIMVILGGLRYVLSGGDSNSIAAAKNTILYALVGLVVAILSQTIVSLVLSRLN